MTVHALIPAAGRGERLRAGARPGGAPSERQPGAPAGALPKQFLPVAGRPLLLWAVERLRAAGVASFVVAVPGTMVEEARALLAAVAGARVVEGGATRQDSVARALAACAAADDDWVLVHDAARAAVHPEDVAATLRAAAAGDGAVLGRPVTDTVKRVAAGAVVETVDRSVLFRAETPQVFRRGILARALGAAQESGFVGTDESSLVERLPGTRIAAVAAQYPNPKATFAADLAEIERLLPAESTAATAATELRR